MPMIPSSRCRSGLSMSIFNTGGTLAFGVGPLFVTWYAARFGLSALPATMALGLMVAVYLYLILPAPPNEGLSQNGFLGAIKESLGAAWKTIALIWIVMVLRAVVGQSFMTFMPVLFVQEGDKICADGIVIHSAQLTLDESILTGESEPVTRGALEGVVDEQCSVRSGATVLKGSAQILVTRTGRTTTLGEISQLSQEVHRDLTPMQQELRHFVRRITYLALGIGLERVLDRPHRHAKPLRQHGCGHAFRSLANDLHAVCIGETF